MGENGGKWGGNAEEMGGKGTGCTTQVSLVFPISPHFSPFSPIFPHFPPFFLAMGTLWVCLWVQYPPPEPGTSEPCKWVSWSPRGPTRAPPLYPVAEQRSARGIRETLPLLRHIYG